MVLVLHLLFDLLSRDNWPQRFVELVAGAAATALMVMVVVGVMFVEVRVRGSLDGLALSL